MYFCVRSGNSSENTTNIELHDMLAKTGERQKLEIVLRGNDYKNPYINQFETAQR